MPLNMDTLDAEPFKEEEYNSQPEAETFGPLDADPYVSIDSLNETIKKKKELPLRGEEEILARTHPNVYAAIRAFGLDLFPYASYVLPSVRDEFMQLDQEDQTRALLFDALGVALWAFAPMIGKDIKYLAKGAGSLIGRGMSFMTKGKALPKVIPFEDAIKGLGTLVGKEKVKPFSYNEELKRILVAKGFGKDEALAMAHEIQGTRPGAITDAYLVRAHSGKSMTKAFENATFWEKGRTYPRKGIKKDLLDKLGEDVVRQNFYTKQFEKVLMSEVYKAKASKRTVEHIFDAHVKRLYPEAGKIGFGDVTPDQMANVLLDMLEHKSVSWQITHPTIMASLKPARIVFGYGEKALNTFENIYKPIKGALARTNRNYFNHSLLFAKMLEQRGAYKSVIIKANGEFKVVKAKWLTPAVQEEAYNILKLIDDYMGSLKRATKAEQREIKEEITRLSSKASKPAKVLIDTWRTYSDHLYGEHVKMQIPRVFRKAGLTEMGQAMVDQLMSGPGGIGYEVDRLFSTVGTKNPTEKIVGVKRILKSLRERLDYVGDVHPYFTAEGDKLEKVVKTLEKELTWKKGGFTKYLDNYVARVSKHEDSLMEKWRGGLFKKQSAAYTKARLLEKHKGAPVNFGTMIQARTMAHAKEHFLYDKLGEVVQFAEKLPPAWVEYVDSYLNGILGRATVSDYKLANFLTKTAGGVSRMMETVSKGRFGGEGLWNEQRVVNLAYTINNMTYLGGLGFKPFSAVRNLFQPLLTVPTDLGGLKDLGKLVEGYKWALNPRNRAFIRDIGAIAEYAPEVHLRPKILSQGKVIFGKELPTMESARDFGMWMFKSSDRFNRYVTGGAATLKWERMMAKIGRDFLPQDVERFSKLMKLDRRHNWVKNNIEDLLMRGKIDDAKALFVKDVIEDTQYLYGSADAPVLIRKHGGLGRTAFIFQSWWMNYGALLEKWLVTGQSPGAKLERLFTGMVSQSMAYSLMVPLWGKGTAVRSTFLGSFPKEFNEFLLPPAWAPVYHATSAIFNIQQPEVSARHAKAVLDSSVIMVPGGLQARMLLKGYKDEGWTGFNKALLRLR